MIRINIILCTIFSTFFQEEIVQALPSEKIIGGIEVEPGSFTYHVYVSHQSMTCGGSIIGPSFVVTAAHCLLDHNRYLTKEPIKVTAGVVDLRSNSSTRVEVLTVKAYVPIKYLQPASFFQKADIAILRLETNFDFQSNRYISNLELPPNIPKYRDFTGRTASVTGYGVNNLKLSTYQSHAGYLTLSSYNTMKLHHTYANIWENQLCKETHGAFFDESEMICAQTKQTSSIPEIMPNGVCYGDSGGPLVLQGKYLIGVLATSFWDCDESDSAAIYTSTIAFRKFFVKAFTDDCDENYVHCISY